MRINQLIRNLEQNRGVMPGTRPEVVIEVINRLSNTLAAKLEQRYFWNAHCTVAVEAGRWGGDRRLKRRQKLAKMIGMCAAYLGIESPMAELPKGWERQGLYYGYSAIQEISRDTGVSTSALLRLAILQKLERTLTKAALRHHQRFARR